MFLKLGERRKELFRRDKYAERIYVEKLKRFDNEDHLLLLLYTEVAYGERYAKVTTISRTRLFPDIDLLVIERPYNREPLIKGFEVKVLNRRRSIFNPFYTGLGQVLSYFKYGVEQAWLIVGIPSEVSKETEEKLIESWRILKELHVIPRYIGLKLIREGEYFKEIEPKVKDKALVHYHKDIKFMREAILRRELVYSKLI